MGDIRQNWEMTQSSLTVDTARTKAAKNFALKPGSIVDLVAPGSTSPIDEVSRGIKLLESWGLRPRLPKKLQKNFLYHSNTDINRFQFLSEALLNEESDAVWCLRGGYGSVRLVPMLNQLNKPKRRKLFIGISDVTSIHLFLNQKWKWPTLHGPVVVKIGSDKISAAGRNEIKKIVFGEKEYVSFKNLRPLNQSATKAESRLIAGKIFGGNLMTLQSSIGTVCSLDCRDRILFIEEISERGYRVDRMLTHLLQAGCLKGVKAVVIGEFMGGDEPHAKINLVKPALKRFCQESDFPVFGYLPVGHSNIQMTLPFGTEATIKSGVLHVSTGVF